jgi:hypothetical protein
MTNFPTQENIINSILAGVKKAKDNFLYWTNDRLSLSYGPDKIVTIHVAQEIAAIVNSPEIFIDATLSDILRCSLPDRNQFLDFMNKRELKEGTFTITLDERIEHKSNNDSVSRVIISVQGNVVNAKADYLKEIDRICKMINRDGEFTNSTLDYGVFVFYTDLSSDARKKLDKRIPEIIKKFDKVVANYDNLKTTFRGGEIVDCPNDTQWSKGCYIIEPFYK